MLTAEAVDAAPSKWLTRLERWQWLLPVGSFLLGWIGYLAIERGPGLARATAFIILMSWPWLLMENLAGRWLNRITKGHLSPAVACFITQSMQQELLFFSLPFVIGASQLDVGHGLFLALLGIAALLSTLDPIYERWIARRPVAAVGFQVYCTWIAALVLLPIALHLPLEQCAPVAAAIALLALALGLPRLLESRTGIVACLRAVLPIITAIALALFLGRWLPPAGLKLGESRITTEISDLQPGAAIHRIALDSLHRDGLIAFATIHAPVGVTQNLSFDWYHRGVCIDRIPAVIEGTSDKARGWRTWTRKQNFDEDPRGRWRVDIRTAGGQLVGRLRFSVD
ncbi:MAG: DUF5924 family protein [Pseudomonadota bacterium]